MEEEADKQEKRMEEESGKKEKRMKEAADKKGKQMEEQMAMKKFEIEKMDLFYGEFQALSNVSLDIYANKITALIGPSGCGKSTFLRSLNRMNDLIPGVSIRGSIRFDGMDIYGRECDVIGLRKRVGMVFQKPNPFPKSIYENITYGPRIHGEKNRKRLDAIVERTLTEVALWNEVKDRLDRPAAGLSGGQQQRLCIARCLAVEPEVILMDEPTSALDPVATAKVEELLEQLAERYTIVIVTHNMQQAGRVSDYTSFFLSGQIIETNLTELIFSNPKNQKTEDYITGRFG